ncbi:MAG: DUF6516 family protein [Methanosarcina mazei]
MNFRDYYLKIESLLKECSLITHFSVDFEEITADAGSLKGNIELMNGSILHFFEFVEIHSNSPVLAKYRYQWQSPQGNPVKRWDNAPHHKELDTFPHHVHGPEEVRPSPPVDLNSILEEIINSE